MIRPEEMIERALEASQVGEAELVGRDLALRHLVEAALDQPAPTVKLSKALNAVLVAMNHKAALLKMKRTLRPQ